MTDIKDLTKMTVKPADVLVFTPHPDDAESAASGTVVRWVREGKDVVYVVCTNGDKGTSDADISPEELVKIRQAEQLAAAEVLGVRDVIFLGYPDQGLENSPEFREEIRQLLEMYRPEIVATTDPYRGYLWHRDHRMAGQAVLDVVSSWGSGFFPPYDLPGRPAHPYGVKELMLWASENPNYHSDITDTFDIKIAALACHRSQVGDPTTPEAIEWRKQRYRSLAEGTDFELAEAFYRVELPR